MLAAIGQEPLERPTIPVGFPEVQLKFAGVVPAGDWGDPLESDEFIEVDAKFGHAKRFAAKVSGMSCYPALEPGDLTILAFRRNPADWVHHSCGASSNPEGLKAKHLC